MSKEQQTEVHTAPLEWLAAYSAGALSDEQRLLIDCQAAMEPRIGARLRQLDAVGGAYLESARGDPLSPGFTGRLFDAIDRADAGDTDTAPPPAPRAREAWMPAPLAAYLDECGADLKWRKRAPGVEIAEMARHDGARLYMMKARPGLRTPAHSHRGEEWALILQGGYHVGEAGYRRGDLHCEDQNCVHQPVIDDDGEACITLVYDEGPVIFANPLLRALQPFIGI